MPKESSDKRYSRESEFIYTGNSLLHHQTPEILNRLADLEEKVFPLGKERTMEQQLLLLKHSGLLDVILGWDLKAKHTAKFLHLVLNRGTENLEKRISDIKKSKWNPHPEDERDIKETLADLGLKRL
jgi:hypothetical protein